MHHTHTRRYRRHGSMKPPALTVTNLHLCNKTVNLCPGHRRSPVQPPQWRVAGSIATISPFDVISLHTFQRFSSSYLGPVSWFPPGESKKRTLITVMQQWILLLGATDDGKSWLEGNGARRWKCNNENKQHWGVNGSCLYKN